MIRALAHALGWLSWVLHTPVLYSPLAIGMAAISREGGVGWSGDPWWPVAPSARNAPTSRVWRLARAGLKAADMRAMALDVANDLTGDLAGC